MERSRAQWEEWFSVCMLINGLGFLPGDPVTRNICGRSEVIERWGLGVEFTEGAGSPCRGYQFCDKDGEDYHLYVTGLFERVHQRTLLHRVLPFHFARGLAVESKGSIN